MKKLFFLFLLLSFTATSFAQLTAPSGITAVGYYWTGQMRNISNTHASATLDTVNGATTYFTISKWVSSLPVSTPIYGTGAISYNISVLKAATVSPTVVVTPQRSFDNTTWVDIPGVTAATVTCTSLTTATTKGFDITYNPGPYQRLKITTTDTASIKAYFSFNPTFTYSR